MESRKTISQNADFRRATMAVPSAQAAMALFALAAMDANRDRITGRAPVPTAPTVVRGMTFMRWEQDTCGLPPEAWKALVTLQQKGLSPTDIVIAHEPEKGANELIVMPARKRIRDGWHEARTKLVELRASATPMARQTSARVKADVKALAEDAQPVVRQAFQNAKTLAIAAAPMVLTMGSALVKASIAAGTVALGAIGIVGALLLADPIMFGIYPADDGGDPVWIEIARWVDEDAS